MKQKVFVSGAMLLLFLIVGVQWAVYQTPTVQASNPCTGDIVTAGRQKAVLLAPKGDIYDDTPRFQWQAVPGAVCYLLWVNEYSTPNVPGKIRNHYLPSDATCASGGTCSVSPEVSFALAEAQWWVTTYFADHAPVESNGAFFAVRPSPTATPTPTPTQTATPAPTSPPTATATPTATRDLTATAEPTTTATRTPTMTITPIPTATATQTPTSEPTSTATATSTSLPLQDLQCGITINYGQFYTRSPFVDIEADVLYANAAYTVGLILMDHGSLPVGDWGTYNLNEKPWKRRWELKELGEKPTAVIVYAHFRNGYDSCDAEDDIRYDRDPPVVRSAQLLDRTLHVIAADQTEGSGVAEIQASALDDFSASIWQPFTNTLPLNEVTGERIYVRVRDGAGNISPSVWILTHPVYLPLLMR